MMTLPFESSSTYAIRHRLMITVVLTVTTSVCQGQLSGPQQLPGVVQVSGSSAANGTIGIAYLMEQLSQPYDIGAISMAVNAMQASGLLASYNVSVFVGLTTCQQDNGTYAGLSLLTTYPVDLIVGPSCPLVCQTVGYLAAYWSKIMMPTSCRDDVFDTTTYPTVMRSAGSWTTLGKVVQLLMQQYGWKQAVLMSDANASQPVCSYGATSINKWMNSAGVTAANYSVYYIVMVDQPVSGDINSYLDTITKQSRIVFFCHSDPMVVGKIIATAQDRGMMDGQYAFFTYTDFLTSTSLQPWIAMNNSFKSSEYLYRMEAFYSIKLIAVNDISGSTRTSFLSKVQAASAGQPWNLISQLPPSILSLYLYDAVSIYIQVADGIQKDGGDFRNATTLFQMTKGRIFNGVSGRLVMTNNSDRTNMYAVYAYRPGEASYYEYMRIDLTEATDQLTKTADVVWGYSQNVPPDIPACGLRNELCPITGYEVSLQVGLSVGIVGSVTVVVLALLIRYRLQEMKIAQMTWKVDSTEIVFTYSSANASGITSSRSYQNVAQSMSKSITSSTDETVLSGKPTAIYRGIQVHVHKIENKHEIKLSRQELIELVNLKEITQDNILPFVGACIEPGNISYLTQYCSRGSIQDILDDDNIKLDWVFKVSMISDIINGMQFLHKSVFQTHGHLTSRNCYMDSRWVVKIGGLAKRCFCKDTTVLKLGDVIDYGEMLWTSPELLRTAYTRPPNGTQKGDVYSFSIIVQQILYRAQPYFSDDIDPKAIIDLVMSRPTDQPCYRPKLPSQVSDDDVNPQMITMMRQCWAEDPNDRPTFNDLVPTLKRVNNGRKIDIISSVLQKLEKYAENLEQTVRLRTTELEEEKRKTDQILFRMLPPFVVDELKAGRAVAPKMYESATVYFSDIVGYTVLSSESTPLQVVDLLNDLYNMFDDVILRYDVYKVETIGDAYMVVSGLPKTNDGRHICEISNMALNLLHEIFRFKIRHRPGETIKLRIGIHTGPCAAGVVGHAMPRYCLFGDTVNVASRMESTGEALKIHLSQWAHEALLKYPGYVTEPRGETFVKGKGLLPTFWLIRHEDANFQSSAMSTGLPPEKGKATSEINKLPNSNIMTA